MKNIAKPVPVYHLVHETAAQVSPRSAPQPAGRRLSIVVLPFLNLSRDPEQEYFVDGATESLTTELSRIAGSFVIARNTAFSYKGKLADVKPTNSACAMCSKAASRPPARGSASAPS